MTTWRNYRRIYQLPMPYHQHVTRDAIGKSVVRKAGGQAVAQVREAIALPEQTHPIVPLPDPITDDWRIATDPVSKLPVGKDRAVADLVG